MLFNSLDFIIFFVVVFTAYVWLPHRGQNILLLVASYFFYGCWDWRFLSLIALSTTVDFVASNGIYRSDDPQTRKRLLVFSIVINLGILGFFKYFNFFVDSATALLAGFGLETPRLNLLICRDIFYTFQSMSYTLMFIAATGANPALRLRAVCPFTQPVAGDRARKTCCRK